MLCSVCQSIEYDRFHRASDQVGSAKHPHHLHFAALSSCEACEFCAAVVKAVSSDKNLQTGNQEWREHPIYLSDFPSGTALGDEGDNSNLLVYCSPSAQKGHQQKVLATFGLYVEKTEEEWRTGTMDTTNPLAKLIAGRPVGKVSNSDECFRLANAWLDECVGKDRSSGSIHCHHDPTHAGVSLSKTSPVDENIRSQTFFPTRTIDVGPADGTCEPRLVEHDGENVHDQAAWATLSHCWGKSSPLTTTLAEMDKRLESIPLDQMPQTFRDAVIITRKIGIRHLWIDSLCIIQDSNEDWTMEASRMGNVYKHGLLNIAANTGHGCHDGIFTQREDCLSPILLPFRSSKQNVSGNLYVRPGRWDSYHAGISGEQSTLSSRGWVLQESVLSPRTLHYSKQQMYWECEHFTYVEGSILPVAKKGPRGGILSPVWTSNKMVIPAIRLDTGSDAEDRAIIYSAWLRLVQNYTSRRLTFPSDIFAALGGLAAEFQARLRDKYLAGLFEGDLLASLLWRSIDRSSAKRRRGLSSAPSWSWASIIGPVIPEIAVNSNRVAPQLVGDCTAKIISVATLRKDGSVAAADDFAEVGSGRIVLEGQVLLQQGDNLDDLCYLRQDAQIFSEKSKTIPNYEASRQSRFLPDMWAMDPKRLAILHMGIWEWWYHGRPGVSVSRFNRRFAGLLLKAVDDAGTEYERVGVVTKEVAFHNVTVGRAFEPQDEQFLRDTWERRAIAII